MDDRERRKLGEMLVTIGAVYGKELTPPVVAVYAAALDRYPLAEVRAAIDAHVRDPEVGKWMPKPAEIIAKLVGNDGHLSAEEAWALVPHGEGPSVVWTDEIAEAAAVAQPLLAARDQNGARMAFRAAYERIVAAARAAGKPARWWLSRGNDRGDVARVLADAIDAGRITASAAQALCPELAYDGTEPPPQLPAYVRAMLLECVRRPENVDG